MDTLLEERFRRRDFSEKQAIIQSGRPTVVLDWVGKVRTKSFSALYLLILLLTYYYNRRLIVGILILGASLTCTYFVQMSRELHSFSI